MTLGIKMAEITTATDKKIKLVVNRIHNLPTPPTVFAQINKVINNPNTSAYQIGAIISEDPALSAKVLKLTNSAFYGLPRTVTSVKQAIVILGMDVVKSLVLSASVFETFSRNYKIDKGILDSFWRHSLLVAFMARIISRTKNFPSFLEAEEAFSAGLLHDIGKLVILAHLPEEFAKIKEAMAKNPNELLSVLETKILGFDHAAVGGHLGQKWNLPKHLVDAIQYHHTPEENLENTVTQIINVSDYLALKSQEIGIDPNQYSKAPLISERSWGILGLSVDQETQLIQLLQTEYMKAETFLKMAQGDS
jgi:putative nucleotidyltransferase with HDIG domain